jgi:NAD dependent epimerase/dehydratase family enzyme
MRTAPVLMKNSGLLGTYAASLPFRILPTTGSSKNYLSWIHLQDLNRFILEAIQPGKFEGIWNLSAPKPATQKQFVEAIDKAVGHKNLHPNVPAWILKMVLGERAALPLTNQRVSADKLISKGFEFQFPEIETAMANLFSQNKNSVK